MNVVSRFLFRLSKSSAHYLVTTCFFVNFFGQLFNQPLGAKSKHTHTQHKIAYFNLLRNGENKMKHKQC